MREDTRMILITLAYLWLILISMLSAGVLWLALSEYFRKKWRGDSKW